MNQPLVIFMRGMRTKGKLQRNNYQDVQRGQSFAGKTSLVPDRTRNR